MKKKSYVIIMHWNDSWMDKIWETLNWFLIKLLLLKNFPKNLLF